MRHGPRPPVQHRCLPLGPAGAISLDFNPRSLVVTCPLSQADFSIPSGLDAIFIPFRGRPEYVTELLASLPETETPVFLLPTSDTDIASVVHTSKRSVSVLDTRDGHFLALTRELRSSAHRFSVSSSAQWDLPAKRNYVLWYARRHRMSRVLLLDDDIQGLDRTALRAGAIALDHFLLSGFFVDDFPDTSAIGHLEIALGDLVWPFLSGSCLFVRTDSDTGFFPSIYNEDWLFMIPAIARQRVCSLGSIAQKPYDPFGNPSIGAFQEFGELIADGLFALLANSRFEDRFACRVWHDLLSQRREFLAELVSRSSDQRHLAILEAARAHSHRISSTDCTRFLTDWELDRQTWRSRLEALL